MSEQRRMEEERYRLLERLGQVQKLEALGGLAAGVSHDLNNVLSAILALASARRRSARDDHDRGAFQVIVSACYRGRDTLSTLVQFARPKLASDAPIDANVVCTEVLRLLESTTSKSIRIVRALSPAPLWLRGDAGTLNHALANLCINACQAMATGGTLTLRTSGGHPDMVQIEVEDTGPGMTPQVLARAVEPFFTTKSFGEGTGLGLSLVHGTVHAHGGTLDLVCPPGRGTLAIVRLPSMAAPTLQEVPAVSPILASQPVHIVVVDDDDLVRAALTSMMDTMGFQVTALAGGQATLDRLAAGEVPDAIVLDLNMPGMSGLETLRRIRENHPNLPVLIASGQPGVEGLEELQQPHVSVVQKPFDVEELLGRLADVAPRSARQIRAIAEKES